MSYIKQQLDALGWQTTVQNLTTGGRSAANVIAEWPYGDAAHVIMAGAHSDSVAAGPGINDDGSGVAALLANATAIAQAGLRPQKRIRFGFWGAEGQSNGLNGTCCHKACDDLTDVAQSSMVLGSNAIANAVWSLAG